MTNFSGKNLCCALIIGCALCFLVFVVHLGSEQKLNTLKISLDSKEEEMLYLRHKLQGLGSKPYHVPGLPTIYIITPTYTRLVQKAELTRLKTVFKSVPNIHWIVVEDAKVKSPLVAKFLKGTGLNTTHLLSVTPPKVKLKETDPHWLKPRGVPQRNTGLSWLRDNLNADYHHGVVYFADDDNTYSTELFHEMRSTKVVSVWPVGLVGSLIYETPIVKDGKVVDWHTYWYRSERMFALDMAGFAVNLQLILENFLAKFEITAKPGFQETTFLESLGVKLSDLEPKAKLCTQVLVWHTRTEPANIKNEDKMLSKGYERSASDVEV